MVMTVMSVATPMVSPNAVSEARSLCPRKASKHCARLSLTASMARRFLQLPYQIPQKYELYLAEPPKKKVTRSARGHLRDYDYAKSKTWFAGRDCIPHGTRLHGHE